jgi:hypothetical protein
MSIGGVVGGRSLLGMCAPLGGTVGHGVAGLGPLLGP